MADIPGLEEIHPSARARLARSMRGFAGLRGWRRAAPMLTGTPRDDRFRVCNAGVWMEGNLGSYIEQNVYLYGGYETDEIALFLARIPQNRRRTILDIGGNVGTHSLAFSKAFDTVHAFEPNPLVVDRLRRNVKLSSADNVTVHQIGLSDSVGALDLFAPDSGNQGLGTFSQADQYDRPLERIGSARIEIGDDYLASLDVGPIDAIKCDVQGFELQVFRGLRETLQRDRPVIWVELGSGAKAIEEEIHALLPLLPQPSTYHRMSAERRGIGTHSVLLEIPESALGAGDYVIIPS